MRSAAFRAPSPTISPQATGSALPQGLSPAQATSFWSVCSSGWRGPRHMLQIRSLAPARVVAPARLAIARSGKQDAERKPDADAERHHGLRMPADLLAHHVVEVGGAVLHPRDRVARISGRAVVGVGRGRFRLLVQASACWPVFSAALSIASPPCLNVSKLELAIKSSGSLFRGETRPDRKGCMARCVIRLTRLWPPFRPSRCYGPALERWSTHDPCTRFLLVAALAVLAARPRTRIRTSG